MQEYFHGLYHSNLALSKLLAEQIGGLIRAVAASAVWYRQPIMLVTVACYREH